MPLSKRRPRERTPADAQSTASMSADPESLNNNPILVANGEAGQKVSQTIPHNPQQGLSTDHLLVDLKRRTISSGAVTLCSQFVRFVLNFGGAVVLARLLTPEDFGLTAMVATVVGFVRVFRDLGLSEATVQRDGITHAQVSNLFWINVAVSGSICLALAASAPLVAWFFAEPRLVPITLAMSVGVLMSGLTAQHVALLKRQMRFGALAITDIASTLFGFLTGVAMAVLGWAYWSLVGLQVSTAVAALLLAWFYSRWRPQGPTRGCGTRALVGFGANLTVSGLLFSLARGADSLLIGRFFGADALGIYSRAGALLYRPLEQFISPLESVFIPTLSRLQSEPERCRRTFLRMYEAMALFGCILTGLLISLAEPLTLVVLGPRWEGSAVIFRAFALVTIFFPLCAAANWLMISQGRGKDSLVMSCWISFITLAAFSAAIPFGVNSVAIFYSVSGLFIQVPIVAYIVGRKGPVRTKDLWAGFLWHLPVWVLTASVAWLVSQSLQEQPAWINLLASGSAGVVTSLCVIFAWPRSRRVAMGLIAMVTQMRRPRGT